MWLEELTSLKDQSAENVHQLITVNGKGLISEANGVTLQAGELLMSTLADLKLQANKALEIRAGRIKGGSAFGYSIDWILDAIKRAVESYRDCVLEVQILSYSQSGK